MRVFCLLFFMIFPSYLFASDSCTLSEVGLNEESKQPEKLFYIGTCNYRNQKYSESVRLWKQLIELKNIDAEFIELQIDAMNNLGFMLFSGYGVGEDKKLAIEYWEKAISLGHTESEYHLCHAHADKKVSTYNPVKARLHCRKAKLIYQGIEKKSKDDELVLKQINNHLLNLVE